ncbi:hypothetical protein CAPTEDRAFT_217408 [Capitella teleta]|uniref:Uncharacterized protein n=1 Tax=Capitella teleta TaxID=283909 RepID=R7TW45_CAPTE|nr:hypothetical protein CAPTEDRAFT_217408 [Capitella teleta]|eukprot:ELT95215.1 hypothetical protein CAPTEDRAFT_217408 [Capitella teleta]
MEFISQLFRTRNGQRVTVPGLINCSLYNYMLSTPFLMCQQKQEDKSSSLNFPECTPFRCFEIDILQCKMASAIAVFKPWPQQSKILHNNMIEMRFIFTAWLGLGQGSPIILRD